MGSTVGTKHHGMRESFAGRSGFIFAAIGSAVGLGNIWRFPYVAYTNGGGAFIIPYLIALLTAGIPLLFLFYAIGHRFRGSPPLAFKRLHPSAEMLGWWQMLISAVITLYYAVVIAWAAAYVVFSFTQSWGDQPADFFLHSFVKTSEAVTIGFDFVPAVLIPLVLVWVSSIGILAFGVQKGIARMSKIFIPLLFIMFAILVVQSLMLPGAAKGLDALFTPDWSKLSDGSIWIAAYGQIFFSLSVGFGIMITYASYLKKNADLTSSALVVGFANSSFEILAGIGVFAALGFIAVQTGVEVNEVASSGIGLAFIGFPTIISKAPFGEVLGVLFFGSLVFAGFTSIISLQEVLISSIKDKFGFSRKKSAVLVGVPGMILSVLLYSTTTGLNLLDVTDAFVNNFGIVAACLVVVITVTAGFNALPILRNHLNKTSAFKVGRKWQMLVAGLTVVVLGYTLLDSLQKHIANGYNGMPTWFVGTFGWGMAVGIIVLAFFLAKLPWSHKSGIHTLDLDGTPVAGPVLDKHLDKHHGA